MRSQSCLPVRAVATRATKPGRGLKVPPPAGFSAARRRSSRRKCGVIRRAALQKPDTRPISMIRQRNFDCAAGFCRPLLSARFAASPHPQPFNKSGFGNARDLGGLMTTAAMTKVAGARRIARHEGVGPAGVRDRQRSRSSGLFRSRSACAGCRFGLPLRPRHHARDPRRLLPQPPRHGHRLSRHRQIDPYRAGRGAAELALRARQPRQPHQPYRSRRQGLDRGPRRQAGHRIPRRHSALGAAAQYRAGVRRIRRRPSRT